MFRALVISTAVIVCEVSGFAPLARLSSRQNALLMTTTDEPLLKVTNAFDSPSIRKLQKDPKEFGNAFDSPSMRVNGGNSDRKKLR